MIGPTRPAARPRFSRRLAKLAEAPFVQGRGDQVHRGRLCRALMVEQIARDLVEESDPAAKGETAPGRQGARSRLRSGDGPAAQCAGWADNASRSRPAPVSRQRIVENATLNDVEVAQNEVADSPSAPFDLGNMADRCRMIDLSDMMGAKAFGRKGDPPPEAGACPMPGTGWWTRRPTKRSRSGRRRPRRARQLPKPNGIVFLDEIDKIAVSDVRGGSVSREGVQRESAAVDRRYPRSAPNTAP